MAKILLVEDNEMNRDMLSRRLIRRGYEVVIAVDGESGLTLAGTEAPNLILMDMSLPILDGWEATRRLKAHPSTRDIPVIALTAHAMSSDRDKAIEAGCDDYDTKPVELPRLLEKIEALMAKTSGTVNRIDWGSPPLVGGRVPQTPNAAKPDHRLLGTSRGTGRG
jgi:two-component system cell cycle response regulator DivK